MEKSTTATRLRVDFSDILRNLGTGPVQITKHGKVVAILTVPSESPSEAPESTVEASATADTGEASEAQETPLVASGAPDNDDIENAGLDGDLSDNDSDGDTNGSEDRASAEDWRVALMAARDRLAAKGTSATQ
jgi:antitoxin (DNA-binding transcriptional repressor) of toxin-antitoxin stability system